MIEELQYAGRPCEIIAWAKGDERLEIVQLGEQMIKNKQRYDAIFVDIDLATEPSEMTKLEAVDWLENLIEDCKSRLECLREEIKDE